MERELPTNSVAESLEAPVQSVQASRSGALEVSRVLLLFTHMLSQHPRQAAPRTVVTASEPSINTVAVIITKRCAMLEASRNSRKVRILFLFISPRSTYYSRYSASSSFCAVGYYRWPGREMVVYISVNGPGKPHSLP